MSTTMKTRRVYCAPLRREVVEAICDACDQPYAPREHPLFLASNSFEGTGLRATCHNHCYDKAMELFYQPEAAQPTA